MVESGAKDNVFFDFQCPKKAKPVLGSRRGEIINLPPPKKITERPEAKSKDNLFIKEFQTNSFNGARNRLTDFITNSDMNDAAE